MNKRKRKERSPPAWISREDSKRKTLQDVSSELTSDLDALQKKAVDAALAGINVFITGVAGTGKSRVTQRIVAACQQAGRQVAVAAPTGVAAVNLNMDAQTIHSLAGIAVPQKARDFGRMFSRNTSKKWRNLQTLVIDEIGMVTAEFLDWLDVHVRRIRVSNSTCTVHVDDCVFPNGRSMLSNILWNSIGCLMRILIACSLGGIWRHSTRFGGRLLSTRSHPW